MMQRNKYEYLRKALLQTRQSKSLTQTEVATRLGRPQSFVSKYESGERRLDVVEFLDVCQALSIKPNSILNNIDTANADTQSILERWGLSEQELTELVDQNPSLRGILLGYIAERKFHEIFLDHPAITEKVKDDDHDRKRKGDRRITYKGKSFVVEVKSLQTNLVEDLGNDCWFGKSQVDASDSREVTFPDGSKLKTTCLMRGEFDLLAVNCFAFGGRWRFVFALNSELPQNTYKKYTEYQRKHLLPTLVSVEWPPKPPFTANPFELLDRLVSRAK